MDTSSPVSRPPLTEATNTVPLFEDELVLPNEGVGGAGLEAGDLDALILGTALAITSRGRGQDNQAPKKSQQSNKLNEERKRYHINSVK